MDYKRTYFSRHAIQRMFERGITQNEVLDSIISGEVITEYVDDKPFPSYLILGQTGDKPLHIVLAIDEPSQICHVITVYIPDNTVWHNDFKTRRDS